MISFLTNTQFLTRFDWRWVAKNVTDGTTLTNNVAATLSELQGNSGGGAVLEALIAEASEMVMAAAAIGNRYSLADVSTYGGSLLLRITSDLTMGLILKRRGRALTDEEALSKPYFEALDYLEQLRRGERIFWAVPNVPEAGVPGSAQMAPVPGFGQPLITQNPAVFGNTAAIINGRWPWGV